MTETVSTERLRMTRKALERAEKFAADYEFDSDEGFHVPSDLERMLMLDMLNGLFDDEEFIAALDVAPPAPERLSHETSIETIDVRAGTSAFVRNPERKAVGVKPLEWHERATGVHRAETIVGDYRVWTHHEADGVVFWQLSDGGVKAAGQGTEAECFAAAQADYEQRVRSALSKPGEQFECPINQPGCTKDCGSYGCGN